MNKYTLFFFLVLLALAYCQSNTKTVPNVDTNAVNQQIEEAPKAVGARTKIPPSEFFGTQYSSIVSVNDDKTTTGVVKTTKTVPPEILTSIEKEQTKTIPTELATNAPNAESSATKIAGSFFAAIVAFIMALF